MPSKLSEDMNFPPLSHLKLKVSQAGGKKVILTTCKPGVAKDLGKNVVFTMYFPNELLVLEK